ncbi:MAG: PKD domain-containing protein [Marinilabiliaceae bacterium]|nr:PKD domain-containing protein [Marinilabiliaceae bacterium]
MSLIQACFRLFYIYVIVAMSGLFFSLPASVRAQDMKIEKLLFCSPRSNEIAPFYRDSVLYFASNRRKSLFRSYMNPQGELLYYLYQVRHKGADRWERPQLFDARYQSPFNNASMTMNAAGNVMVVSHGRNDELKAIRNSRHGDLLGLYQVKYNGKGWGKSSLMPFSKVRDYSLTHPCLSPDGQMLFFVSDNSEGIGKSDIYMSEQVNGEWSEPVNLGKGINTHGNELFPFYHVSGKLFFASDGQGGYGGLDIFYTRRQGDGTWADPVLWEQPVNSGADDFGFYLSDDENWGFVASSRAQSDDIYRFERQWPTFDVCEPQVDDAFCFTFFDEGPYKSDTIPFVYRWNFGDGQSGDGLEVDHCFAGPGNYRVTLSAIDLQQNKEMMVVADYLLELQKTVQVYIHCSETILAGKPFECDVLQSVLPDMSANEYYWDMGDGTRLKGERVTHVYANAGTYIVRCGTVHRDTGQKYCSTLEVIVEK